MNKAIIQSTWPFTSSDHAHKTMPEKNDYYVAINLKLVYHQCNLPEEYRDLTTFICKEGRFFFTRYSMGLSSSLDIFNQMSNTVIYEVNLSHFAKVGDDMIINGQNKHE